MNTCKLCGFLQTSGLTIAKVNSSGARNLDILKITKRTLETFKYSRVPLDHLTSASLMKRR